MFCMCLVINQITGEVTLLTYRQQNWKVRQSQNVRILGFALSRHHGWITMAAEMFWYQHTSCETLHLRHRVQDHILEKILVSISFFHDQEETVAGQETSDLALQRLNMKTTLIYVHLCQNVVATVTDSDISLRDHSHKQMTSPSNTPSATSALHNAWLEVKYRCFEYVWIVLNVSLMESRFKPVMSHISLFFLSLYVSFSNLHWRAGDVRRVWRAATTFLDLWPPQAANSLHRRSNKLDTNTNSLFLLKPACAVFLWPGTSCIQERTNTELRQTFRTLTHSPGHSYSPSPPFLTSYSLFSCFPPSLLLSVNVWMGAPGRHSHRVVFVKGEKGSSDPGGSGYCGG